jgi:hypothetical protein
MTKKTKQKNKEKEKENTINFFFVEYFVTFELIVDFARVSSYFVVIISLKLKWLLHDYSKN